MKYSLTSSSFAASRSPIEPMLGCAYAKQVVLSNGQRMAFRNVGAYGWLSTRNRFSSFTVARWFSRFSCVTASERIRSASSQRARFNRLDGMVS